MKIITRKIKVISLLALLSMMLVTASSTNTYKSENLQNQNLNRKVLRMLESCTPTTQELVNKCPGYVKNGTSCICSCVIPTTGANFVSNCSYWTDTNSASTTEECSCLCKDANPLTPNCNHYYDNDATKNDNSCECCLENSTTPKTCANTWTSNSSCDCSSPAPTPLSTCAICPNGVVPSYPDCICDCPQSCPPLSTDTIDNSSFTFLVPNTCSCSDTEQKTCSNSVKTSTGTTTCSGTFKTGFPVCECSSCPDCPAGKFRKAFSCECLAKAPCPACSNGKVPINFPGCSCTADDCKDSGIVCSDEANKVPGSCRCDLPKDACKACSEGDKNTPTDFPVCSCTGCPTVACPKGTSRVGNSCECKGRCNACPNGQIPTVHPACDCSPYCGTITCPNGFIKNTCKCEPTANTATSTCEKCVAPSTNVDTSPLDFPQCNCECPEPCKLGTNRVANKCDCNVAPPCGACPSGLVPSDWPTCKCDCAADFKCPDGQSQISNTCSCDVLPHACDPVDCGGVNSEVLFDFPRCTCLNCIDLAGTNQYKTCPKNTVRKANTCECIPQAPCLACPNGRIPNWPNCTCSDSDCLDAGDNKTCDCATQDRIAGVCRCVNKDNTDYNTLLNSCIKCTGLGSIDETPKDFPKCTCTCTDVCPAGESRIANSCLCKKYTTPVSTTCDLPSSFWSGAANACLGGNNNLILFILIILGDSLNLIEEWRCIPKTSCAWPFMLIMARMPVESQKLLKKCHDVSVSKGSEQNGEENGICFNRKCMEETGTVCNEHAQKYSKKATFCSNDKVGVFGNLYNIIKNILKYYDNKKCEKNQKNCTLSADKAKIEKYLTTMQTRLDILGKCEGNTNQVKLKCLNIIYGMTCRRMKLFTAEKVNYCKI